MDNWASKQLPERLPFSKKRLSKRILFSYIADYIIILALIALFLAVDKIPPFHQPFALENYSLHYPFATKERVPVFWCFIYAVVSPMVIIAIYTLVIDGLFSHQTTMLPGRTGLRKLSGRYRFKDRLWELNCGILGLGLSVGAAFTVVGALKNAIGKPRPDLISRCMIDDSKINHTQYALQTVAICTQKDNYILQDGFKSFPSGHAGVSFAGLFYLSIYLSGKLHVLDAKGEVWRTFIVMVPTLGAALITGTRIMDARHHPFDVIFGSALGILCAWGSYRQYFPAVTDTWHKGRAYPIRSWGKPTRAPGQATVTIQEDAQPLRGPIDEERGEASGYTPTGAGPGETNVFRQQLSDSQRRRGGSPYGTGRSDTGASSNYRSETLDSTMTARVNKYQGQLPASNPFEGDAARQRRLDTYDYSSSDDEHGHSYELQQRSGRFTDAGYHPPPTGAPTITSPPAINPIAPHAQTVTSPTGDLSERKEAALAGPPHAGTGPQ